MSAELPLVPAHHRRQPDARRPRAQPCRRASAARPQARPATSSGRRTSSTSAQVARTAEQLGFEGVLTPTGTWCEDAWLVTAALIRRDQQAEVPGRLPARAHLARPWPPRWPPAYQRISRGRLLLNVVTGGQAEEQRRFGDHLSHDERYARTGRVPRRGARRLERAAVRLRRPVLPGRGGYRDAAAGPGTRHLLRRLVGGRRAGRGPLRRRLPDLGRAAGAGRGEAGLDARAGRRGGPGAEVRHPAACPEARAALDGGAADDGDDGPAATLRRRLAALTPARREETVADLVRELGRRRARPRRRRRRGRTGRSATSASTR